MILFLIGPHACKNRGTQFPTHEEIGLLFHQKPRVQLDGSVFSYRNLVSSPLTLFPTHLLLTPFFIQHHLQECHPPNPPALLKVSSY